jgi:ribosomal protein S18 acetylase RimI-like enzyme
VRPAGAADAERIVRVRAEVWQAAYAGMVPEAYLAGVVPEDSQRVAATRERLLHAGRSTHTLVAVTSGMMVGYVTVGPFRDQGVDLADEPAPAGEIYSLYVAMERWGEGIGTKLLEAGLSRLASGRFATVHLWLLQANQRAARFAERNAFKRTGSWRLADLGGLVGTSRYTRWSAAE